MTRLVRLSVAFLLAACAGAPQNPPVPAAATSAPGVTSTAPAPATTPPPFRLPRTVRPTRYALDFTLLPARPTFEGVVDIELELDAATSIVWLHAVHLDVHQATFTGAGGGGPAQAARVVPGGEQLLGFQTDAPLGPGAVHLRIAYAGRVSPQEFEGFFHEKEGKEWYVFTQGEAIGARRMFPCFDEPSFKVPFRYTVHIDRQHDAYANTPVASTRDEPDGMKAVSFVETRPIPSYLVAIAVGPFEVIDVAARPTRLRVIIPRGHAAEESAFARAITPGLLTRLEAYFGSPYPYEKLDLVVVPFFLGAMENPGLITFTEPYILAGPGQMTVDRQRKIAGVILHEMTHMWFGDLVTMAWWDDVWLNESLTSWMTAKILAAAWPEWRTDVDDVKERSSALGQDAYVSVARLRQPVDNQGDLERNGNRLIYTKGAAMLRMFEAWLGPDVLQKGVRVYLDRYKWRNAAAADFLAAIGEVSGRDVSTPYGTFLDQGGAPLVSVDATCVEGKPPTLTLAQERLVPTGAVGAEARRWQIPVCVRWGSKRDSGRACTLLGATMATLVLEDAKGCPEWIVPNADARGYYRSWPKGSWLDALARAALARKSPLSPAERVGLVGDLAALVESGHVPLADALATISRLAQDDDEAVVAATLAPIGDLERRVLSDEQRPGFARLVQKLYGARARALGWTPRAGESDVVRALRAPLVSLVATLGEDTRLAGQARSLALAWLSDRKVAPADVGNAALTVAAYRGDAALFERVQAAARATPVYEERRAFLAALGRFTDPALVERALALVLTDEFLPRETRAILTSLLADRRTRQLAYDWIKTHFDTLVTRLPHGEAAYIVGMASVFCDEAHEADVQAFFGPRAARYPAGEVGLAEALEKVHLCRSFREAQAVGLNTLLGKL